MKGTSTDSGLWTLAAEIFFGRDMEMSEESRHSLPAGRPPWDPWNGARVGGLAGGIVGILVTVVSSMTSFWLVLVGAAIGGGIGYWSEKRKQRMPDSSDAAGDG